LYDMQMTPRSRCPRLREILEERVASRRYNLSRHTFAGTPVATRPRLLLSILWRKLQTMTTTITTKLAGGLHCTLCLANQGEVLSFQVLLPNGRNVELCSKEGADEFVDAVGTDFISTNLTATGDKLSDAYVLILAVAKNASPEKRASGIPESELRTFIEHMRDTLDTISTDRSWLRTGTLSVCHEQMLQVVARFVGHPSFIKTFLSNEGMEAVAKFYASRKKYDTPSHKVAQLIRGLVHNALCVLKQEGINYEKGFGIIEKTGLLGQFIRCVPVDPEGSAFLLTSLQTCLQLVKKKLKSGTRTGDILDAVIAGKDGPINEKAKSSLSRLQSLARLSNDNYDNTCTNLKNCEHCTKMETLGGAKLMKCQRCKVTYYCSKQCQIADWKIHKKRCNELGSYVEERSALKISQTTNSAFVGANYFDIAKEVYKKTQEYSVPKKEVLLELDFYGDAPALRNEFKVWLVSGFLEGSSVADAPNWFRTYADKKELALQLREQYQKLTSDDLFVVSRASDGMVSFQPMRGPVANPGANADYQLLSDEAVESIGREDYARMVACLGQYTTAEYFSEKSPGLT
jgi:hypothetical protein